MRLKSELYTKEQEELLAMIVETKDSIANGIQLYDASTGILKVLDQSTHIYSHLQWGEESDYLFAIKAINQERSEEVSYHLLHWKDFSKAINIQNNISVQLRLLILIGYPVLMS